MIDGDLDEKVTLLREIRDSIREVNTTLKMVAVESMGELEADDETEQFPHVCPKCNGWKKVQEVVVSCTAINYVDCPVCGGEGVLWR
jgi:hypothetical protein